jgi:hypothetical protein
MESTHMESITWCHDIQHNDIQHNDIQHNDMQHNDTQHNDIQHNSKLNMTLSIMLLCCDAEYHLCYVSIMKCRKQPHYAECRYAECRYAAYCYAECRYAECRYAAECH